MVRSLPSRTAAIMPHPHEQKLHEVVNSLTSESFMSCVAARIAGTSMSPPSASPDPPAKVSLKRSLRLIVEGGEPLRSAELWEGFGSGASSDSSMRLLRAMADKRLVEMVRCRRLDEPTQIE